MSSFELYSSSTAVYIYPIFLQRDGLFNKFMDGNRSGSSDSGINQYIFLANSLVREELFNKFMDGLSLQMSRM